MLPSKSQPQLYAIILGDVSEITDRAAKQLELAKVLFTQAARFDADLRRKNRPLGTLGSETTGVWDRRAL